MKKEKKKDQKKKNEKKREKKKLHVLARLKHTH